MTVSANRCEKTEKENSPDRIIINSNDLFISVETVSSAHLSGIKTLYVFVMNCLNFTFN